MKAQLTFLFILFIGLAAQAQSTTTQTNEVKVEIIEITAVTYTSSEDVTLKKNTEVARLSMFKNFRIKKALNFTTKKRKVKIA